MPNDVENHVRAKVRHARWKRGMTPEELGRKAGFSISEIEQLESGENTTFVSDLWEIATALGVPIAELFEGLEGNAEGDRKSRAAVPLEDDVMQLVQFVRIYSDLGVAGRRRVMDLAQTLRHTDMRAAG